MRPTRLHRQKPEVNCSSSDIQINLQPSKEKSRHEILLKRFCLEIRLRRPTQRYLPDWNLATRSKTLHISLQQKLQGHCSVPSDMTPANIAQLLRSRSKSHVLASQGEIASATSATPTANASTTDSDSDRGMEVTLTYKMSSSRLSSLRYLLDPLYAAQSASLLSLRLYAV
jgi:hypothetical protein